MSRSTSELESQYWQQRRTCSAGARGVLEDIRHLVEASGKPVSEAELAEAGGYAPGSLPSLLVELQGVGLIRMTSGLIECPIAAQIARQRASALQRARKFRARQQVQETGSTPEVQTQAQESTPDTGRDVTPGRYITPQGCEITPPALNNAPRDRVKNSDTTQEMNNGRYITPGCDITPGRDVTPGPSLALPQVSSPPITPLSSSPNPLPSPGSTPGGRAGGTAGLFGEVADPVMIDQPEPTAKFDSEVIYQAYPRHVAKQDAIKAIGKALILLRKRGKAPTGHSTWGDWLLDRVKAYATARRAITDADPDENTLTPHPATWMNQGRYDDDPDQWTGPTRRNRQKGREYDQRKPANSTFNRPGEYPEEIPAAFRRS